MNRVIKTKFGVPVRTKQMMLLIANKEIFKVPKAAILEILTWKEIYKSNYSFSFYDRVKGWQITQPGTIRISDHWGFSSQGKIHCSSDPPLGQDVWAKGIWNPIKEKYDIVEYYTPNKPEDKEKFYLEMNDIRQDFKNQWLNSRGMHSDIEEGKKIATWVDNKEVFFQRGDGSSFLVHKVKKDYIVIYEGEERIKVKHGTGNLIHGEDIIKVPGARLVPLLKSLR